MFPYYHTEEMPVDLSVAKVRSFVWNPISPSSSNSQEVSEAYSHQQTPIYVPARWPVEADASRNYFSSPAPASNAAISSVDEDAGYEAYRAAMIEADAARNRGVIVTNPRMRRSHVADSTSEVCEDTEYRHRRARNNAAAKQSRDKRKLREWELCCRASYLEQENKRLRQIISAQRNCLMCGWQMQSPD